MKPVKHKERGKQNVYSPGDYIISNHIYKLLLNKTVVDGLSSKAISSCCLTGCASITGINVGSYLQAS